MRLTQGQHLVRIHGDDGAEGVLEGVDVIHVEVVRGYSVGNGIFSQHLWLLVGQHVLRVKLHRVVAEF